MVIKHMPSGLFPHFDSGLERRPYFVKAGEQVEFGCRLDGSTADSVLLELTDGARTVRVPGIFHSANDRGQRYFRFVYRTREEEESLRYRFVTSRGEVSQEYECPILRELTFTPADARIEKERQIIFQTDTQAYKIELSDTPCIRVILEDNLTVKTNEIYKNAEQIQKELTAIAGDGTPLLRILPELRVMVDEHGAVKNLRLRLRIRGKAVYGLGEKFDTVDQAGKSPLNYVVEQFSNQQDKTYLPIPFFFTEAGVSFLQKTTYPSSFAFSAPDAEGWITLELFTVCAQAGTLFECSIHTGTPAALLRAYAEDTGEAILPPKWAFGPWMSSNGWNTQKEALEQLAKMHETAIPATVMVLEAWSDEETFYIWNDAEYTPRADGGAVHYEDFTFRTEGKWPDPRAFCRTLADENVKLILWQIPVIKYEAAPHGLQLDLDWEYAKKYGLCLKNADGTPYQITEMWFGNSLIPDFTNPETKRWWLDCRRYLVEELGVAGFKTDGGEFLFDPDARFSDGRSVAEAHNAFPNLYESVYHELTNVTFSRAGYTGAQKYPIHWAGDQLSTFAELKGQLTAGLSAGLSGVPFWGFDIGGFAGDFPSTELYLRSAALAAFAPVMQFHSEPRGGQYDMVQRNYWNNDRSPWNMALANRDESIVPIYRLFANLRMNLLPYLWQEAQHCSRTLRPMMAHLVYDYPQDANVLHLEDEYLLGRSLLAAPVIEEGAAEREVYLPDGLWHTLWTGKAQPGGQSVRVSCPLTEMPVFVRDGTALPLNLNDALIMGTTEPSGAVSNRTDGYENLCFLLFGAYGESRFRDELGNDLTLRWQNGEIQTEGTLTCPVTVLADFLTDGVRAELFGRTVYGIRKEPR